MAGYCPSAYSLDSTENCSVGAFPRTFYPGDGQVGSMVATKKVHTCLKPGPLNVTLSGKRVFADVVK